MISDAAGPEPLISVVICTRDRADLLRRAIVSVLEQEAPRPTFELLVVDNASSDHTPEVVQGFAAESCVRYLHEPVGGISTARNTGWRAAKGRYIAYLDDDALASSRWLQAIRNGFETTSDKPGIVGGRVLPIWESRRPAWLSDKIAAALAIIDWGDEAHPIGDLRQEWLVSANFAIPRLLLEEIGGFHPLLGWVGDARLPNEDILLQKEVMRRGYGCLYYPTMTVEHWVPTARLSKRWLARRFYWQGVGDAVMQIVEDAPPRHRRLIEALIRAAALLRSPRKLTSLLLPTDEALGVTRRCLTMNDLGYISGLLGTAGH